MPTLQDTLRQGLVESGLALADQQVAQLMAYLALIDKWNKVYNLTAVRVPAEMVTHHLLDSLAVVLPLRRQLAHLALGIDADADQPLRLLDVGSGAGLPGVVLAICCPDVQVDCVDTVGKKAAFIQQVALALQLPNLRGRHARVENLTDKYNVIISRAFASLPDFTNWSRQALTEQGIWLAMKGKEPVDEVQALPPSVQVFHVEPLTVPGLDAQRCIVWMRAAGSAENLSVPSSGTM